MTVEINNDGFRDGKSLTDSNSEHWFLVGDSFGFGFGFGVEVQHRFSNLLESQLETPIYNIIPNNLRGHYYLVEHARQKGAKIGRLLIDSSIDLLERIAGMDGINDVLVILIPSRDLWLEGLYGEHEKIHDEFAIAFAAGTWNL